MEFSSVNTIWVLLGAALVFFMQAGFSMCEAGFTRAKNTGNILMKNLMDFCIGTPCFWLVGFGIMFGAGTGLFATGVSTEKGVFYGGGFHFFGVQCLGVASVILYVAVVITIVFAILKHTIGLRVTPEEEITGLDVSEHGLLTAYAGFAMLPDTAAVETDAPVAVTGSVPAAEAIPVKRVPSFDTADGTAPKFTKVEIICKESKFEALKTAMLELGITGMTMSHVLGCGIQKGKPEYYRGVEVEPTLLPKIQLDIVVSKVPVHSVIETAKKVLYTGHIGDGKIFVYDVENVVKVRTGEEGYDALQDVE